MGVGLLGTGQDVGAYNYARILASLDASLST